MNVRTLLGIVLSCLAFSYAQAETLPDPGTLVAYLRNKGQSYLFEVTGSSTGRKLCGHLVYSPDSSLAMAAVYSGILKDGEKGVVKVTILPGFRKYMGGTRNGVTSTECGAHAASYKVESSDGNPAMKPGPVVAPTTPATPEAPATPAISALPEGQVKRGAEADPGNLTAYATKKGEPLLFQVTGATIGAIWGTDFYTLDSTLAVAAVHSGALKAGETGVVKVTILDGRPKYTGSVRNGVTTANWPSYPNCYRVERVAGGNIPGGARPAAGRVATPAPGKTAAGVLPGPANLTAYAARKGEPLLFRVTGVAFGALWGTDFYTLDSTLAAAAVHSGTLKAGETGVVKVTILDGRPNFQGSDRNGVTSANWPGSYPQCYRVENAK